MFRPTPERLRPISFVENEAEGVFSSAVPKSFTERIDRMACFCTLASGSSGNSTYIGSGVGGVLIDAGISCRAIFAALQSRGIERTGIGAVFITHEHIDHVKGLKVLLKRLAVPVYATEEVLDFLADRDALPADARAVPMPAQGVAVGDLYIGAFETPHDSVHSVGYVAVSGNGKKMAVSTDLGAVTPTVRQAVDGCDLVLLESNYDKNMLMAGGYPYPLKRRIDGEKGHLSNEGCAAFLPQLVQAGARRLVLGHLSRENNLPGLALETAALALEKAGLRRAEDYEIEVAPRYEPGSLICL